MAHEQTLRGALLYLCGLTEDAWRDTAVSGSDIDVERAQNLGMVAKELARTYEDVAGGFDSVLDAHGNAYGFASEITREWEQDEKDVNGLSIEMLRCAKLYADVAYKYYAEGGELV